MWTLQGEMPEESYYLIRKEKCDAYNSSIR